MTTQEKIQLIEAYEETWRKEIGYILDDLKQLDVDMG